MENKKRGQSMSSFKEFMDDAEKSSDNALSDLGGSLSAIQFTLTTTIGNLLTPLSAPTEEKQKFSEDVSNLVQDEAFLSELSNRIDEPLEQESEDEFVMRSSNVLRKMLYTRFDIND
jgi:hypothetical protein